jgi:heptosyltransferase III
VKPLAPLLALAYGTPRRASGDASPERVLVIRRNGIGDMICALPLLRSLRQALPRARIDVLASASNAAIARGARAADEVLVYGARSGLFRNKYVNLFRVARGLQGRAYDLVVAVSGSYSPFLAAVAFATRAPRRAGYVARTDDTHFAFNLPVGPAPEDQHQVTRCLRLLEPLGLAPASVDLGFDPGDEARDYALAVAPAPFILYNASATRPWNAWTGEKIASLARGLRLPLLVSGVAADRALLQAIAKLGPAVVEPPSILHFAALAERSALVMSGDGGAVHVGAAVRKPTFVLYPRSGDPRLWAPYGVPFAFVRARADVAQIEPREVLQELEKWLAGIGRGDWI